MRTKPHGESRALLFAGALLSLTALSGAAELRLQDILAPSEPPAAEAVPADPFAEFADAVAKQPRLAASAAESLLERFEPNTPEHEDALARVVSVFAGRNLFEDTIAFAGRYAEEYPDGRFGEIVRARTICARVGIGDAEEVADDLRTMAELGQGALLREAGCAWDACEALMERGDAVLVRRVALSLESESLAPGERAMVEWWLLESLLVEDDPDVAVPPAPTAASPLRNSLQLRRALVLRRRGNAEAAAKIAAELSKQSRSLSEAEQRALGVLVPGA